MPRGRVEFTESESQAIGIAFRQLRENKGLSLADATAKTNAELYHIEHGLYPLDPVHAFDVLVKLIDSSSDWGTVFGLISSIPPMNEEWEIRKKLFKEGNYPVPSHRSIITLGIQVECTIEAKNR